MSASAEDTAEIPVAIKDGRTGAVGAWVVVLLMTWAARGAFAQAQLVPIDLGYVGNTVSDSISVIDTRANQVADEILLDGTLRDTAVGPGGRFVYATLRAPDEVAVVDLQSRQVVAQIDGVGALPEAMAVAPDGRTAYATSFADDTVAVIDTRSRRVLDRIAVQHAPNDLAVTLDSRFVMVTNHFSDSVSVIDAQQRSVVATIPVGEFPTSIALTPNGRSAYVVNFISSTVSVIDTASRTVRATVFVDILDRESLPSAISVTPDGRFAYMSSFGSGTAITIDTATDKVMKVIEGVGTFPADVAVSPRGDAVYVSSFEVNPDRSAAPGAVMVIDAGSNALMGDPIGVGELPVSVRFPLACLGDCGGDGEVTVSDLIVGVGLLLDGQAPLACAALDGNKDSVVTIEEIVGAVDRLLNGCAPPPVGALTVSPRAARIRAARAAEREGRCGSETCAVGDVCVRDLPCHLRGCVPNDRCCTPGDVTCGAPLP